MQLIKYLYQLNWVGFLKGGILFEETAFSIIFWESKKCGDGWEIHY
jgi:hypothetical protein